MEEKETKKISEEEYLKIKRSDNKKTAIIAILVFTMILMLLLIVIYFMNGNKKEEKGGDNPTPTPTSAPSYVNTFKHLDDGSYGVAYVTGYVKVVKEANCGSDICPEDEPTDDVINFYITKTESDDLKEEISNWYGEDFNENMPIKLGCLKGDVVSYYNAADAWYDASNTSDEISTRYSKSFTLDKNVTTKLLNSNVNNPITLKLEKFKLTHGGEAFSCYSHFSGIEIVD